MIHLTCVQYMKHKIQITQERWEHDLTPWSLCNKRLLRCQKVKVVFVTITCCSIFTW